MKKIFIVCSLATAPILLLAGCDGDEKVLNSNNTTKGLSQMKRIKTDSGLEYEIIKEGLGDSPKVGQTATVNYTGWLNNNGELGKKFDSSLDRNQPFSFKVGIGQVISGWDEGVGLMKTGGKYRFYIPADLGYGSRGAGGVIPPNANLIFDVELIKIS